MSELVRAALAAVVEGRTLSMDEARGAMGAVMDGEATPAQLAALLVALRMRGETVEELAGFAAAMRERGSARGGPARRHRHLRHRRRRERHLQHLHGRGARRGRGRRARWPSTATGRSPRPSGSADVLEALGVRTDHDRRRGGRGPARRSASPSSSPRASTRPCATPARPAARSACGRRSTCSARSRTRPGRAARSWAWAIRPPRPKLAEVLRLLGTERALVVHGAGLDELPLDGSGRHLRRDPGRRGTSARSWPRRSGPGAGADLGPGRRVARRERARSSRRSWPARPGPRRDVVLLNAAAALSSWPGA